MTWRAPQCGIFPAAAAYRPWRDGMPSMHSPSLSLAHTAQPRLSRPFFPPGQDAPSSTPPTPLACTTFRAAIGRIATTSRRAIGWSPILALLTAWRRRAPRAARILLSTHADWRSRAPQNAILETRAARYWGLLSVLSCAEKRRGRQIGEYGGSVGAPCAARHPTMAAGLWQQQRGSGRRYGRVWGKERARNGC